MSNLITPEGLKNFEAELAERLERRREIAKAIKSAKEQGDLSENAEYSEAKHQLGENEKRINWLRSVIDRASVVKNNGNGCVGVGCLVELKSGDKKAEDKLTVKIVGTHEVNPREGKISHESPLGKAIIGKKKGEKVEVETPSGKEKYEIRDIK